MTYGSVSSLFMGDVNADAETRIANSQTNLQADDSQGRVPLAALRQPAQPPFPKHIQKSSSSKWGPGIPMALKHQRH